MSWKRRLALFLVLFAIQGTTTLHQYRNAEPRVGDAAEVHNIAWSLAHGRGYRFDWDDAGWKTLWKRQNTHGQFDFIVNRRGSYPTMYRPPLMPLLVAAVIKVSPGYSFAGWRLVDAAAFSAAGCLLCELSLGYGGGLGLVAMLSILLLDPLRREFVPGWWTEGLAFDLVTVLVWMIGSGRPKNGRVFVITGGVVIGLLCLDRSIFVLAMPLLAVVVASCRNANFRGDGKFPRRTVARRIIARRSFAILSVAAVVQLPWWIRNIELSGRFLPLGTQGGYNLPDEYGQAPVDLHGVWNGRGIVDAWTPPGRVAAVRVPPGFTPAQFDALWSPRDPAISAVLAAATCTSTESEIAVADAGQRSAVDWIRRHPNCLPWLVGQKLWELTRFWRTWFVVTALMAIIGLITLPTRRGLLVRLAVLIAINAGLVAVTHVVWSRFLVPILPAVYVTLCCGVIGIGRLILPKRVVSAVCEPVSHPGD